MQKKYYDVILDGLQTILSEGGNGNFVIFELSDRQFQYIQVAGEKDGDNLWVEAGYTEELSEHQKTQLEDAGWETPEEANLVNYSKQIPINSLDDCDKVAEMILETFLVVYDLKDNEPMESDINLEEQSMG